MPTGVYKHKPHTKETKKKLSLAKIGDKNPAKRLDVRKKISLAHKGIKFSEEHKRRIGKNSASKKPEWKKMMSVRRSGKNNPNYRGGIEHRNKTKKEWRKKNKNYIYYLNTRRRVLKMEAEGSHTFGEWELLKRQYGYKCPCCQRKEPEIILTQDHIIPLIKGGSDYIENIQPLCKSCNSKKYDKIIKYKILNRRSAKDKSSREV